MSISTRESDIVPLLANDDTRSSEDIMADYLATRSEHLYEQLYARHCQDVHEFLVRFLRNYHDAEEVTQYVFLRMYQRPQSYRPGRLVHPWLIGIARHEAADFLAMRNAKKRCDKGVQTFSLTCTSSDESCDSFAAEIPDQRESLPDEEAALREIHNELQQCVASLRDCDRDVIRLVHLDEMSHRQTAELLGISEGTVRNRNRRGLSMLRDILGESHEGKEPAA